MTGSVKPWGWNEHLEQCRSHPSNYRVPPYVMVPGDGTVNPDGPVPPAPPACPGCGWVPTYLPRWARSGALFRLGGKTWRVVSVGGTNSRRREHFEPCIRAQLVGERAVNLPDAPCSVSVVRVTIAEIKSLPVMFGDDMVDAVHLEYK